MVDRIIDIFTLLQSYCDPQSSCIANLKPGETLNKECIDSLRACLSKLASMDCKRIKDNIKSFTDVDKNKLTNILNELIGSLNDTDQFNVGKLVGNLGDNLYCLAKGLDLKSLPNRAEYKKGIKSAVGGGGSPSCPSCPSCPNCPSTSCPSSSNSKKKIAGVAGIIMILMLGAYIIVGYLFKDKPQLRELAQYTVFVVVIVAIPITIMLMK